MAYKPYPEYKDSGVEWLGQVPKNWKVDRLKWTISSAQNGVWGDEPDGKDDVVCIRVADFDRVGLKVRMDKLTLRSVKPNDQKGRILNEGDLLIEKSGGGELQPVGTVVLFDQLDQAVCSNFIARMVVKHDCNSWFLKYLHFALYSNKLNLRSIKQTTGIQNLDLESYLSEMVVLPSPQEQNLIVSFLDRETARIESLINKKQKLVELLQEKRQVVISQAVTKGLDPNVKMKDSGIEWIGKIPEHWNLRKLKTLASIKYGLGELAAEIDGGLPLLRATNVKRGRIDSEGLVFVDPEKIPLSRDAILHEGDIIVVRSGAYTGDSAIVPKRYDGSVIGYDMVIRTKTTHSKLLAYELLSESLLTNQIDLYRLRAAQPHLNAEELGACICFVPPLAEQIKVVGFLDCEIEKIENLVYKIRAQVEKLQEYRQTLISAAVTGKIDLRDEVV